jgi:hypothetical protein
VTVGIYTITIDSKYVYVGQSLEVERRKLAHFGKLTRGKHENRLLQQAFDEATSVRFELVETCSPAQLTARESAHLQRVQAEGYTALNLIKPQNAGSSAVVAFVWECGEESGYSDNLAQFCRSRGLSYRVAQLVLAGARGAHKGYRFRYA